MDSRDVVKLFFKTEGDIKNSFHVKLLAYQPVYKNTNFGFLFKLGSTGFSKSSVLNYILNKTSVWGPTCH